MFSQLTKLCEKRIMQAYKLNIPGAKFPLETQTDVKKRGTKRKATAESKDSSTSEQTALKTVRDRLKELESVNGRHFIRERKILEAQLDFLTIKCKNGNGDDGDHDDDDVAEHDGTSKHDSKNEGDGHRNTPTLRYVPHSGRTESCLKMYAPGWLEKKEASCKVVTKYNVTKDLDMCTVCNQSMKVCNNKGIVVCDNCGRSKPYMDITVNALPYKNNVDVSSFSYKRINHFNDWLLQIQGKEGYCVADEVIEKVKEVLVQERVPVASVSTQKVREVLKVLKMNTLYDNVTQITCKITGQPPPALTAEDEERCRLMFISIQEPFELHCPPDRKNFLSYPYCLYKFLELLQCTEVLRSFILLKGRDKLQRQDQIFKNICSTLGWKFIPSV